MAVLREVAALEAWLEDEGGLFDDAELVSSQRGTLVFDAELTRTGSHVSGVRFSLSARAVKAISPSAPALTAVKLRQTTKGTELGLSFGRERHAFRADAWTAKVLEKWKRRVPRALDPCCLDAKVLELSAATLVRSAKARGVLVEVFDNWVGSGSDFGSAFVTARAARRVAPRATLDGAWRIVPKGEPASSPRGVWLEGVELSYPNTRTLRRTRRSDLAMVRAVALLLAELGEELASGNEPLDHPTAWVAGLGRRR